ncbi:MAG: SlyX family protein [Pikeienuella sp.]
MTSDRIDALEEHIAHQQMTIDELQDVSQAQWAEIENLKRQLGKLTRSLEAMVEGDDDAPPVDTPPPHY